MGVARAAERKRMMERLTKTSEKDGLAFTFDLDVTCSPSDMRKIYDIGVKLKAYEDTGLTPEQVKAQQWISVKDRLPEDDIPKGSDRLAIKVMVSYGNRKNSVRTLTRWRWIESMNPIQYSNWIWSKDADCVTHWMPLPEPPKEAQHDN